MSAPQESRTFRRAQARAHAYLGSPEKLRGLTRQASLQAAALGKQSALTKIWKDLSVTFRLLGQLCAGAYDRFPVRSLLLVVAGLLYFLWPFDLVPDAIPFLGWLDDATLLAFVLRSIQSDLDAFQRWEQADSAEPTLQAAGRLLAAETDGNSG